jgi:NIMA (never in mitosis gene a)-related kinase
VEYCEKGDLGMFIKEKNLMSEYIPEDTIIQWFTEISSALQYVHSKKILHRDIKASNIYMT